MPTISVIIPTYNSSRTLRLALESVLLQDYADFEIWVVGDGCTDDSEEVVASFDDTRVRWLNLTQNSGTPSLPRNEGIHRARGEYIAYLGHDDLWLPWHLSGLIDCIESNHGDMTFSLGVLVGPAGVEHVFSLPEQAWDHNHAISPSNWLHRKDLVQRTGNWSPKIKMGDDRAFLHRIQTYGARINFCQTLSVLKFPSAWWKLYALNSDLPQLPYAQVIRQDARELERKLLIELGARMARQEMKHEYAVNLPKPARVLIEWFFDAYGRNRWPLNDFLYWRWRRSAGLNRK